MLKASIPSFNTEPDKARRYLDLLNTARCDGRWQEIPELARKIEKHAPRRKGLALTARAECRIASISLKHPTTSSTASASTSLSHLIPPLLAAIDSETNFPQDRFEAKVCLAWLHWTLGEPELAMARLPTDQAGYNERCAATGQVLSGSTHVCIVRGAYIHGSSQEMAGNVRAAVNAYNAVLPYISEVRSNHGNSPEQRIWTEKLLQNYCLLVGEHVLSKARHPQELLSSSALVASHSILVPFRAWASFSESEPDYGGSSRPHNEVLPPRRRIWRAYYDTLSIIIQHLCSTSTDSIAYGRRLGIGSKAAENAELRRVEITYEELLLKEVGFPEANKANVEVETWTDQVMTNWSIISAPEALDEDLEKGGRIGVSGRIIDILYRAATRTFHSTRILRHLFTVHATLAEFNLAIKALDSYIEIVSRAKARVEKSGEPEIGLDDDSTVFVTISAGISILCVYGRRSEAERAQELANLAEEWLQKYRKDTDYRPVTSADDVPQDLIDQPSQTSTPIPETSLASILRAIGLCQAHWSRLTYQPSERSDLQAQALSSLRRAVDTDVDSGQGVENLYSLALAYAGTRDIDAGIASLKSALIGSSTTGDSSSTHGFLEDRRHSVAKALPRERRLRLRCWHLLSLLITAKDNLAAAVDSCTAALEIYGGDSVLLGDDQTHTMNLGFYERRDIIEIKMTQLTLTEVIESPAEAVNASSELLGLYSKLFKYTQQSASNTSEVDSASPPESANGAPQSLRSSVIGRAKNSINRRSQLAFHSGGNGSATSQLSPHGNTTTPAIQVTSEGFNDEPAETPHYRHAHLSHTGSRKLQKSESKKSLGSIRKRSPARMSTAKSTDQPNTDIPMRSRPTTARGATQRSPDSETHSDEVGVAVSHDGPSTRNVPPAGLNGPSSTVNPLPPTSRDRSHPPPNFPNPHPEQNRNSGSIPCEAIYPPPEPLFSPSDLSRHSLTLLVKIWIFISSLYRRACMLTDSAAAVSEATTHTRTIESLVVQKHGSSNTSLITPGWGGAKAVAELWADIYCEQAMQALAKSGKRDAEEEFEEALLWWPDHIAATVGLCNLLFDAYEAPLLTTSSASTVRKPPVTPTLHPGLEFAPAPTTSPSSYASPVSQDEADTELLSRLAARDRAYGLLSALTKSGHGWDSSEAWMALARAYELGGQVGRAKEALWWVVELEEARGIREWGVVGGW